MKKLISTLFLLHICSIFFSQHTTLAGQVSIHNSKYNTGEIQYVKGAYASAPFTSPDDTDENGWFYLEFVGIADGTSIELSVEKSGYEVVNQSDLLDVVVGRKLPVRVYLATKGQLAKAQTELYNVSLKAITQRYDETIAQLREEGEESQAAIKDLEQKLNRAIANRFEAEQLLNEQLLATKQRLPEFARELATVNLDFASQMYQEAYEYFKAGEIEKAIETLDEAILDQAAIEVVQNLDSLGKYINDMEEAIQLEKGRFDELIKLLRLKGKSYHDQSEYALAKEMYWEAIQLLKRRNQQGIILAEVCWEKGQLHQQIGETVEALNLKLKSLSIYESLPEREGSLIQNAYLDIAIIYEFESNLDTAILYRQKAFNLLKGSETASPHELEAAALRLQQLLRQRALELQQQGTYSEAIEKYQEILNFSLERKEVRKIQKVIKRLSKQKQP